MLREMLHTRQVDGDPHRRWFYSWECELYVWLDDDARAIGFQLCYDKALREHAFSWKEGLGASHMRVDSGDRSDGGGPATPMLVANGAFDARYILDVFRLESRLLPPEYVSLVTREVARHLAD
jgi:hypothetical protein